MLINSVLFCMSNLKLHFSLSQRNLMMELPTCLQNIFIILCTSEYFQKKTTTTKTSKKHEKVYSTAFVDAQEIYVLNLCAIVCKMFFYNAMFSALPRAANIRSMLASLLVSNEHFLSISLASIVHSN